MPNFLHCMQKKIQQRQMFAYVTLEEEKPSADKGMKTSTQETTANQANQTRENLLSFTEAAANLAYWEQEASSLIAMALAGEARSNFQRPSGCGGDQRFSPKRTCTAVADQRFSPKI